MMDAELQSSAARLAEAFDRGFAAAPSTGTRAAETYLAILLDEHPYAVRTAEISGLLADRRVVALPTTEPALLGVASFRGRVAPVYDLAKLLGHATRNGSRWLILIGGGEVALAVTHFEQQFSLTAGERMSASQDPGSRPHVKGAVRLDAMVRPVLDLPSVAREIERRARAGRSTEGG